MLATDLRRTEKFYGSLGFMIEKADDEVVIAVLGKFYIHFHTTEGFNLSFRADLPNEPVGRGMLIYIEVDDAKSYSESLKKSGIIGSVPQQMPWGNIEFGLQDPDGYNLCFYQLKK